MNLYPAELRRAFDEVGRAYDRSIDVLKQYGPGPEYNAAADYAEGVDDAYTALADAYTAANPKPITIPAW